jgi:gluconokinase
MPPTHPPAAPPRFLVVMGVSGAGKTTVGRALASALGWPFHEGDAFHPAANVERMARGQPLTDADRAPWLAALRDLIARALDAGEHGVLACSALRERYRAALVPASAAAGAVRFVFLDVPEDVLRDRLEHRAGHYMPPSLLPSQLRTLEPPQDALRVDGTRTPAEIVDVVRAALEL